MAAQANNFLVHYAPWPPANALLSDLLVWKVVPSKLSVRDRYQRWPKVFRSVGLLPMDRPFTGPAANARGNGKIKDVIFNQSYILHDKKVTVVIEGVCLEGTKGWYEKQILMTEVPRISGRLFGSCLSTQPLCLLVPDQHRPCPGYQTDSSHTCACTKTSCLLHPSTEISTKTAMFQVSAK